MAVLHMVGYRYILWQSIFSSTDWVKALMNLARSLCLAFDELPFIELSSPHETVISWNCESSFFHSFTMKLRLCEFCFNILLGIYVTSTYRPRAIITVIMPVTVTMIVIVVTVLAIKVLIMDIHRLGWYALGFSRYTLELLSSGRNILFPPWNRIFLKQNSVQIKRLSTQSLIRKLKSRKSFKEVN